MLSEESELWAVCSNPTWINHASKDSAEGVRTGRSSVKER